MATADQWGDSHYETYRAGSVIIEKGDSSRDVFRLVTGVADVVRDDEVVGQVMPGEYFGTIAAFTGAKRNADVMANSDCVVRKIDQGDFLEMLRRNPEIGRSFK